ncbi:MAG TPA: ABC transporter substrate-binding protein [Burkholderiales bacterium]|jgi:ABC-type nitrate/sulfonate/bicarbonate transport system substrate-binding protein
MPAASFSLRRFLAVSTAAVAFTLNCAQAAEGEHTLRLDYAAQAPTTVVAKKFGWVEEALRNDGVTVQWVRFQGAGALPALARGEVDFALVASGDALKARAAGVPVKAVYVYAHPTPASYGFVAVSEPWLAAHRSSAARVIAAYEHARHWIAAHPQQAAQVLAQETGISQAAAQAQLAQADLTVARPGPAQAQALRDAVGASAQQVAALLDDGPIRAALLRGAEPADSRLALGL